MHGSEDSFNLNPVLLQAITRSIYFQNKCLKEIQDWNRLVDEIYYEVKHLQPFSHGTLLISLALWGSFDVILIDLFFLLKLVGEYEEFSLL